MGIKLQHFSSSDIEFCRICHLGYWLICWFFQLVESSGSSKVYICGETLLLPSEDHHDGKQHDVQVHLRVPWAGKDRLWGVWCRVQVCEKTRWLHLRHQKIEETSGRISRWVSWVHNNIKRYYRGLCLLHDQLSSCEIFNFKGRGLVRKALFTPLWFVDKKDISGHHLEL